MSAPDWLRKAVIYQILIDRFARGGGWGHRTQDGSEERPVFCGGNLQGVTGKLDYIANLGANAIWLSPFNRTAAYHGYHITDFFRVEPRFGGEKAFRQLVRACETRGIRLIMDFVPNHVHVSHPFFQQARRNRRSRYRDWFYWRKDGSYLCYFDFQELPKLNLDHPDAREHIIAAAQHWLDCGISGLRLDHALGPSLGFWREFRRAVKSHHPDAALIGEVAFWGIERRHLPTLRLPNKRFYFDAQQLGVDVLDATMLEYAEVFDGLLDFHFQKLLKRLVANISSRPSPAAVQKLLDQHYAAYPPGCCLLSFLDNHDLNRFLFEAGGKQSRLLAAARLQFAQPHPPIIYYGTETAMIHDAPISGDFGDLRARRLMRGPVARGKVFKEFRRMIGRWRRSGEQ